MEEDFIEKRSETPRRADDIENQIRLSILEAMKEEDNKNEKKYAIKLVELIVFSLLTIAFLGMCGYFWHLITTKPEPPSINTTITK